MKNNTEKRNRIFSLIMRIAFSLLLIFTAQILPLRGITTVIVLAGSGPSIYFPEDSWDFGEITPDTLPTHTFKFKNTGDEALIIKGTKVSCESCIVPIISAEELNPGEEGELKITVNSLDMIGRFTKRIYVESNDPANPRAVITVSGFIQPKPQPQTSFKIGMSYFGQGEYDKAIIEFEKSIELDPENTENYYYLGQCYLQKGVIEYNKKHILKAYDLYQKSYKISEQVIPLYEKRILEDPEDLDSYIKLGYIFETRSIAPFVNEYDKAVSCYLKALDLDIVSKDKNSGVYAYFNIRAGFVYFEEKNYAQTVKHLENAINSSTHYYNDNAEMYYYLGVSYDKMGEQEKALVSFSRVIEIAPESEFARDSEKILNKINK